MARSDAAAMPHVQRFFSACVPIGGGGVALSAPVGR
jgi:hypothetical protein